MDFRFGVFCSVLLFLCVSAQHDHHNHEEHRVNVDVYYESLCPDSKKFFTQQLYPSLQGNLSRFVNLTLVPYGKSNHTPELNFNCHHGPAECTGNKIQACALRLIDNGNPSPNLGYNKVTVGFINCLMDKAKRDGDQATFPTKECADVNSVGDSYVRIETCANSSDGSNFLAFFGGLTEKFQNPLKSVPTIVFNKQFKKEDDDLAESNFVKALCKYIQHDKPMECNSAVNLKFSVMLLAVVTLFSKLLY